MKARGMTIERIKNNPLFIVNDWQVWTLTANGCRHTHFTTNRLICGVEEMNPRIKNRGAVDEYIQIATDERKYMFKNGIEEIIEGEFV